MGYFFVELVCVASMIYSMSNYSNITLIPNYFDGTSRSEIDTSVEFLGKKFKLPVVPANMSSVIDEKIAYQLSEGGYFYIMHRFYTLGNSSLLKKMNNENWKLKSISVGVKDDDKKFIEEVLSSKLLVDFITIDIAHGHSKLMKDMIAFIRSKLPEVKIIAGNVCTFTGAWDLYSWGADCVKVGIAQGGACSTFGKTGFGLDMPKTLLNIYHNQEDKEAKFPIIADGGVRVNGDIAKAIVLAISSMKSAMPQSDFKYTLQPVIVMAGSLFAACSDSPAEYDLATGSKTYYGSASARQKGHNKNVEGFETSVKNNGMTYAQKLNEIQQDLQSSISYAGGKDISALGNVYFTEQK